MDKQMQNIDDLFKDALGDYAETPPPAAWSALDKKLDAVKTPGAFGGNKKIWLVGLIGLLLFSSLPFMKQFAGSFGLSGNSNATALVNETTNVTPQPVGVTTVDKNSNNAPQTNSTQPNPTDENATDETKPDHKSSIEFKAKENKNIPNRKNNATYANSNLPRVRTGTKTSEKNTNNVSVTDDETADDKQSNKALPIVYNSSSSNPAPADEADANDNSADKKAVPAKTETSKKTTAAVTVANKNNQNKKPKVKYNRFELGIKAGYERGFDNDAAKKLVVSPYIQLNISPKFSFMIQPSIKEAWVGSRRIGNSATYYKANNDSSVTVGATNAIYLAGDANPYLYRTNYSYTQTHDSIVKSNSIGGNYLEIEIPLLLKYYIHKKFSVYAGVNLTYSKLMQVTENTYIKNNIPVGPIDTYVISRPGETPVAYHTNSIINYNGNPYSSYTGPQYPTPEESTWRAGYMAGFSYEFSKRILFDCLVQQAKTKTNMQSGYNINTSQSAPYIRFTLGYKLTK